MIENRPSRIVVCEEHNRLPGSPIFRTEDHITAFTPVGMSMADTVALYLRTYWDTLGF